MKIADLMLTIFDNKKMGKVIVITGCPGVGKSTISLSLGKRFKKCYYISVDNFREKVVSGYEFPAKMKWNKETFLQSRLARESALYVAKLYSDNGFDVVVDDTVYGENVDLWLKAFPDNRLSMFCLCADLGTVMKRNKMRKAGRLSDQVIKFLFREFETFQKKHRSNSRVFLVDNKTNKSTAINRIFNALT